MGVEIIAEAAQGYEGDLALARRLARGAAAAGADAVKFQLVHADELATPDYQYYELFRQLEMPDEAWRAVIDEAKQGGARCYFDVFGLGSLARARALGADGVKVHASDFFNDALMREALAAMPRVYAAIGGIAIGELEARLAEVRPADGQLCLLYGFQAEPTPIEANHLRRLAALQQRLPGHRFGFMDHTDGESPDAAAISLMAAAMGAVCVEKHVTLDRALKLEDYVSALPCDRLAAYVRDLRRVEPALGSASLELAPLERAYRRKALKVVVAQRAAKCGDVLTADALCLKRVGRPAAATLHRLDDAVGRTLRVDVGANQAVTQDMLGE
jgi:N,N'-diacetyllegionaminate synthase